MNEFQVSLLLSPDPAVNAFNVSSGRDQWDVNLDNEITMPQHAQQVSVEITRATMWFTTDNISAERGNNKFYLDVEGDTVKPVTLTDGLYDLSSMAHTIDVGLVNQGMASRFVTFTPDNATQHVIINFSRAGLRVDLYGAGACRKILGFKRHPAPLGLYDGFDIGIWR